ncbi:hypothetical protein IFM61606_00477 [Aspergillus udagawae]|uniref:Uncharacterized protein n=1 Tax=Aspergillus udagawae TaxID=91492 RepID=A0ABQ1AS11_9EURO|nr:hypothetical protein IFM51744_02291 [Aspergillus udagawae]GFF86816.1 hypothetical protein IFM53868_04936 [Aspergillus udagawae]GFG20322.1 hypothetical protein IFM61606_00477 [Aspergillus udagawae]
MSAHGDRFRPLRYQLHNENKGSLRKTKRRSRMTSLSLPDDFEELDLKRKSKLSGDGIVHPVEILRMSCLEDNKYVHQAMKLDRSYGSRLRLASFS